MGKPRVGEGMSTIQTAKESWHEQAQAFERHWWESSVITPRDPVPVSKAIMERWGYAQDRFKGMNVLDVGCGPTQRLSWLTGVGWLAAIEPLAATYRNLPGSPMKPYESVWAVPVETYIEPMVGWADFIFSINSLDHCFDLPLALSNLYFYCKTGGSGMLSMDCDKWVSDDPTHPICVSGQEFKDEILKAGFTITREMTGDCRAPNDFPDAWGGGLAYHYEVMK
jgi:SAM-dependent methyltransferase